MPVTLPPGMGKAFNKTCLDRVGPSARHNDGNRLGRIHGRPDHPAPSCYHDDFNLETDQLGRKLRVRIDSPSVYRYSVAMF